MVDMQLANADSSIYVFMLCNCTWLKCICTSIGSYHCYVTHQPQPVVHNFSVSRPVEFALKKAPRKKEKKNIKSRTGAPCH